MEVLARRIGQCANRWPGWRRKGYNGVHGFTRVLGVQEARDEQDKARQGMDGAIPLIQGESTVLTSETANVAIQKTYANCDQKYIQENLKRAFAGFIEMEKCDRVTKVSDVKTK